MDNKYFILLQKQITKHTPCVCSELDSSFCEFTIFQSRARKPQCHVGNWVRWYKRKPKPLSFSTNCVLQACEPVPLCQGTCWHSSEFCLGEQRVVTEKVGKEQRHLEFIISWPEPFWLARHSHHSLRNPLWVYRLGAVWTSSSFAQNSRPKALWKPPDGERWVRFQCYNLQENSRPTLVKTIPFHGLHQAVEILQEHILKASKLLLVTYKL